MNVMFLYAIVAVLLFIIGFHGLVAYPHLLRKILALNIMGSAIFLFLVSVAYGRPEGLPDPVPHAMVLTGIVVTVSATAFALILFRRLCSETGKPRLPDDEEESDLP
jgi:multicomponent Na+:H+ antiporter subunit C